MDEEEKINCSNCGFTIASVVILNEGSKSLQVPSDIQLRVIDKEKNIGKVICPKCGFENKTNLSFWKRF